VGIVEELVKIWPNEVCDIFIAFDYEFGGHDGEQTSVYENGSMVGL